MGNDETLEKGFLRLVMNNIPSFVFWKDRECVYMGCNENFAKSAGYNSAEEIFGKTDFDMPWSDAESEFFRKVDKEVMDANEARIDFEEQQTTADGDIRWLKTSKIPLTNNAGEVIGILGTYEDITDIKNMQLQLAERNENLLALNKELEETNSDLIQFTYGTSHDLIEPLVSIKGFTNFLEKNHGHTLNEEGIKCLNYIKKGIRQMHMVTDQILNYNSIDRSQEKFEKLDFNKIFSQVVSDLSQKIEAKKAIINANLPEIKIFANSKHIQTLFENLLLNSIYFNKSEVPKIDINFQELEKEWLFSFSDNGIGIDAKFRDIVFMPFKRLNNREDFPGVGLGLAICKRIVSVHKGRIYFEDNPTGGTIFYFSIRKS